MNTPLRFLPCLAPRAGWPAAAALLGATLVAPAALAQPAGSVLDQRVWLRLSQQQARADSMVRVDSSTAGLSGTAIDLESDLDLPQRRSVGSLQLGLRLGQRWRTELEHFSLKRERNDYAISRSVRVEDTEYAAQALLDTRLDSTITRLSLGYSFWQSPGFEFGAVLGVHRTRFKFEIGGEGSFQGQTSTLRTESTEATAPLPTIGLFATWVLGAWTANARTDVFSLKRGGYDGRLLHAQASLLYQFNPHLGLGLGYRVDDYRLRADRSNFKGGMDYRFNGPQLLLQAGF